MLTRLPRAAERALRCDSAAQNIPSAPPQQILFFCGRPDRQAREETLEIERDARRLLLQHATHPDAPALPNVVRAKILRGMHLVQPVRGSPGKANFTFCQQVTGCHASVASAPGKANSAS